MKNVIIALVAVFSCTVCAQKSEYPIAAIAEELKDNANAVVRLEKTDINIASQRSMNVKTYRAITVLNQKGLSAVNGYENYDKTTTVKSIEAVVYDVFGNEIKRIKRKDFKDQSAAGEGTLFSDNRVLFLDYTPVNYPFTIVYQSEVATSNTAFIPKWYPVSEFYVSVEKSIFNISYPNNLGFKKKEINFSNFTIQKTTDTATQLSYSASNIPALKSEPYASQSLLFPRVMLGLEIFNLEGIDGNATSWIEFGKWWNSKILEGKNELSEETKNKMIALVGNEKDPIAKAKLIYNYVQQKVRYVSIQEGIGGWMPMSAKDVDRLGYGDCKALSNYTKALLEAVGVQSFYTKVYGDRYKIDIVSDFVSTQGNHIILAIPNGNNYTFLECTSQDDPFGYQANFTDDRDVLIIKPEGGEIVRTKNYEDNGNCQNSIGSYVLTEEGDLTGNIKMMSSGAQYGHKTNVEKLQPVEKEEHYKEYWDHINNLKIEKSSFSNDKEKIQFTENVQISAKNYGSVLNGKMMFVVNVYNLNSNSVKRVRNRKSPFEIQRGYLDTDEVNVALPKGYKIEFLPDNFELKGKFGECKTEVVKKEDGSLVYKRSLLVNKGVYSSAEYEDYRLFMEQISRNDNAKIILTKI
ncbi:transglutaminase [Flavobacterium glycines]|uniref:Transglutaminase n=1 Tax=Flavobacterium glycines TaxID=551990 RepID=A0A1B9DN74_9FLAO|nr:transglutaminase [Flavobacterium glycines]